MQSKLKRILVYVSDHHYGHATRMVALARALFKTGKYEITVKNSNAFGFLKSSLPEAKIENVQTDVGPIFDLASNNMDVNLTIERYLDWIQKSGTWISREKELFRKNPADLIITDISPNGLRLAEKIKCPAITVTNFSWTDILRHIKDDENKEKIIQWLNESFSMSELTIKLPFSTELEGFAKMKECSLLCRDLTASKEQILNEFNLRSPLVVISFGDQIPQNLRLIKNNNNVSVAILSHSKRNFNDIPVITGYSETQNIMACADLVITKAGYSTTAECVKYRTSMYIVKRENYYEETVVSQNAVELGIAKMFDLHKPSFYLTIPDQNEIIDMRSQIRESAITSIEKLTSPVEIIKEFI